MFQLQINTQFDKRNSTLGLHFPWSCSGAAYRCVPSIE